MILEESRILTPTRCSLFRIHPSLQRHLPFSIIVPIPGERLCSLRSLQPLYRCAHLRGSRTSPWRPLLLAITQFCSCGLLFELSKRWLRVGLRPLVSCSLHQAMPRWAWSCWHLGLASQVESYYRGYCSLNYSSRAYPRQDQANHRGQPYRRRMRCLRWWDSRCQSCCLACCLWCLLLASWLLNYFARCPQTQWPNSPCCSSSTSFPAPRFHSTPHSHEYQSSEPWTSSDTSFWKWATQSWSATVESSPKQ